MTLLNLRSVVAFLSKILGIERDLLMFAGTIYAMPRTLTDVYRAILAPARMHRHLTLGNVMTCDDQIMITMTTSD